MSTSRVNAPAASLVCSVLNTRWPVSEAWMALFRRFAVTNFPDQDHVGIVPQDASQARGERQPDLRMDLDLADAGRVVFDGIFDRDDLESRILDRVERRIKRRRFAASGRPGDEHDPVRQTRSARGISAARPPACRRSQVELHPLLVEQPQNDPFAVEHGDDGNANVDLAAGNLELDASVLREPLFGDIETRHDFQTRDNG